MFLIKRRYFGNGDTWQLNYAHVLENCTCKVWAVMHCITVYCLYLSVVELSVHIDLTLSDVASEIRDGVSDVCREGAEGGGRQDEETGR